MKAARVELIVLASLLAFDLLTKGIISSTMREGQSITIIPKFLNFNYVVNPAAAMGFTFWLDRILSQNGVRIVFLVVTLCAIAGFFYFMIYFRSQRKLARISFAMIIAGAFGNFFDRLFFKSVSGYFGVRDFIEIEFFGLSIFGYESFFIFNIADVALTTGVIIFAVFFIFMYKPPKPEICGPVFQPDYKPEETAAIQPEPTSGSADEPQAEPQEAAAAQASAPTARQTKSDNGGLAGE